MYSYPSTQGLARWLVSALLILGATGLIVAAEIEPSPSPASSPTPTAAPSPTPIPLADVVGTAESVTATLREIETNLAAGSIGRRRARALV